MDKGMRLILSTTSIHSVKANKILPNFKYLNFSLYLKSFNVIFDVGWKD